MLEGLEPNGRESLTLGGVDRLAQRLAPRLLALFDRHRDAGRELAQEVAELVRPATQIGRLVLLGNELADLGERNPPVLEILHGEDLVENAAELADVSQRGLRHRVRDSGLQGLASFLGLAVDDGHAGLVLGRPQVDDQSARETRQQARVESVDVGRGPITREHDLTARRRELVQRLEEHLLGFRLPRQELDVVEQEDVQIPIPTPEAIALTGLEAPLQLAEVFLERHVLHVQPGGSSGGLVGDRGEDVGLAQPRRRIEEERIVARSRGLRRTSRRGRGQPVGGPDDERIEGQLGIEIRHGCGPASSRGRGRPRLDEPISIGK
jgi:hypothetical protein